MRCACGSSVPPQRSTRAYAALERWMAANGVRPRGAPWEIYVTDPGEQPNPAEWLTEVYWPFAEGA